MSDIQTIPEYQKLIINLSVIEPFRGCCSSPLLETIYVEPLAGREPSEIERTCVVKCPECKKMYVSKWDW